MQRSLVVALVFGLTSAAAAFGQTTGAGYADALSPSLANVARAMHATIRRDLAEAAEAMPAEEYGFQPTPQVRTFGQLVGHVISANLFFCSQAGGEKVSTVGNYDQMASKSTLVTALRESLALCDRAYDQTTDANFNQAIDMTAGVGMGPAKTVRGAILMFNVAHNNEHYGNIVVYMRLKGLVPPSTARAQQPHK